MSEFEARLILAYANHNMNMTQASKSVCYSRFALVYHFDKVQDKTGLDPRNFYDLVKLVKIAEKMRL